MQLNQYAKSLLNMVQNRRRRSMEYGNESSPEHLADLKHMLTFCRCGVQHCQAAIDYIQYKRIDRQSLTLNEAYLYETLAAGSLFVPFDLEQSIRNLSRFDAAADR